MNNNSTPLPKASEAPLFELVISFRGKKVEMPLLPTTTLLEMKAYVVSNSDDALQMSPHDIKLIHKGKVMKEEEEITSLQQEQGSVAHHAESSVFSFLTKTQHVKNSKTNGNSKIIIVRLMATGYSPTEANDIEQSKLHAPRVRDDISQNGKQELERRQRLGREMLTTAANKGNLSTFSTKKYGFGRIEALPMLPSHQQAKEILNSLANDPGILACMAKHQWNVGCLAELYPEGKVGESPVCVMGLNENNGARILLRLRTDDLTGFRKILGIRKVLFHELAHNVHSEHNTNFFQLMRQIEKECNDMDWTQGDGVSKMTNDGGDSFTTYQGGTYRLGGGENSEESISPNLQTMSIRDLTARAAMARMSQEEQEIEDACGCGRPIHGRYNMPIHSQSSTTSHDLKAGDEHDEGNE